MQSGRKIVVSVLLVLLGLIIYGRILTRGSAVSKTGTAAKSSRDGDPKIDQTPLQTAQRLAQMPTTAAELTSAQEALRLADQEMDLDFAAAVLGVVEHPPELSPEAKEIQARLDKAEASLAEAQADITRLTAAQAKARGARRDALDDQLRLAKAQLELDQGESEDAKQDLIHAGGDSQGSAQRMAEEHEAASRASDATKVTVSEPVTGRGLVNRSKQWWALHTKQLLLWQAKQDAVFMAATLQAKHEAYEQQLAAERTKSLSTAADIPGSTAGVEERAGTAESAATVRRTRQRAAAEKMLANLNKRIDKEKQLAAVYGDWIEVVAAQQRAVLNKTLGGAMVIVAIALVALLIAGWIQRALGKMSIDRRQAATLKAVARGSLRIFTAVLILLVIFGPQNQLGTFLGFAGAGLTIALKDFIISFFGWFVLMGKNGIRLGDWVEINGVTGEVAQLGVFHTVLMETGSWTDPRYPTGRRVTFTNSFAIERHYFNFSTSGQWLWDELQIALPAGHNPYALIEAIEKMVREATLESTRQAEKEWQRLATSSEMTSFSAAPAVNVKLVVGGIQVSVRYITHADERAQMRAKLNGLALDLLGLGAATGISPASVHRASAAT